MLCGRGSGGRRPRPRAVRSPDPTVRRRGRPRMSEPTYGSGPAYDPQQGYGGVPGYGQQYGGQPGPQYGTGQQPQQPAAQPQYGSYAQQQPGPAGYPSGGHRAASSGSVPAAPRTPPDRLGLAATVVTILGYVCAGAGL